MSREAGERPESRIRRSILGVSVASNPTTLEISAAGWLRPDWIDTYYPEGLPPMWRLAYYANDFRRVLVPGHYARWMVPAHLDRWSREVPPGFRFWLEVDAAVPVAAWWAQWRRVLRDPVAAPEGIILSARSARILATRTDFDPRNPPLLVARQAYRGGWLAQGPEVPEGTACAHARAGPDTAVSELVTLLTGVARRCKAPVCQLFLDAPASVIEEASRLARLLGPR